MKKVNMLLSLARLCLGFTFLWAFFDKVFGLGFSTTASKSWLNGVSPTAGFLKAATHGPFVGFYHNLVGNPLIDWLFMLGLLLIGSALILGIGIKIAGLSGALMLFLMYLALLPPTTNPVLDEHIIYILLSLTFATGQVGTLFSFQSVWQKTKLVQNYPFLA